MVTTTLRITVAELERDGLPEGRWEVSDGELIEMPAAGTEHSRISLEIGGALVSFVKPRRLGLAFGADGGVILVDSPLQLRVPDAGFVRAERLPANFDPRGYLRVVPDLVAEVISPTDRRPAVLAKAKLWLQVGASLVWVVDPASRTVIVFRKEEEPRTLTEDQALDGEDVLPGFTLPLRYFFDIY